MEQSVRLVVGVMAVCPAAWQSPPVQPQMLARPQADTTGCRHPQLVSSSTCLASSASLHLARYRLCNKRLYLGCSKLHQPPHKVMQLSPSAHEFRSGSQLAERPHLSLPKYRIFSSVARSSIPITLSTALAWATVVRSLLKTVIMLSSR